MTRTDVRGAGQGWATPGMSPLARNRELSCITGQFGHNYLPAFTWRLSQDRNWLPAPGTRQKQQHQLFVCLRSWLVHNLCWGLALTRAFCYHEFWFPEPDHRLRKQLGGGVPPELISPLFLSLKTWGNRWTLVSFRFLWFQEKNWTLLENAKLMVIHTSMEV